MNALTRVLIGLGALVVASGMLAGVVWGLGGLSENLVYYWSPTELVQAGDKAYSATVRLGGMVEPGSVDWDKDQSRLAFRVTDGSTVVSVVSTGAPPQMFREGIGVVVEGEYAEDGVFHTDRVMVKHSNEYRAPHDGEHPEQVFQTLVVEES